VKKRVEFWVSESGVCLLEGWARSGLCDWKIAKKMGIKVGELRRLAAEHDVIGNAISKGKEVVDLEVEGALLKKALTGDVRACSYWLKNRMGGVWRDKGKEGSAVDNGGVDVDGEIDVLLDGAVESRETGG